MRPTFSEISSDGTVAASYYYDAFGNILEQTGEVSNSVLFAGYHVRQTH
ncbi:MAG: hypothetical protein PHP22_08475 [Oscillospiraceae bacterium]|nr:hypothetical protein [Oscillospiraceae bacterium]